MLKKNVIIALMINVNEYNILIYQLSIMKKTPIVIYYLFKYLTIYFIVFYINK